MITLIGNWFFSLTTACQVTLAFAAAIVIWGVYVGMSYTYNVLRNRVKKIRWFTDNEPFNPRWMDKKAWKSY